MCEFLRFDYFNLVLLVKNGWRLLENLKSLVAHVLKVSCFPNQSFLEAQLGHSPSYTWRSIWSVGDLIQISNIWKMGSGEKIKLWGDVWLREKGNNYLCPLNLNRKDNLWVENFINAEDEGWNRNQLEAFVSQEEVQVTLSVMLIMKLEV